MNKESSPLALSGKVILLGLSGSIALYKSCELVRRLKDEGADIFCLMTQNAQRFVSAITFRALSGNPVAEDLWDGSAWNMAHLDLADKADLFIIAPSSASLLARLAAGMGDDAVCATALAVKSPVLVVPAMHEGMWLHPATQSNVKRLKSFGYIFVGPEKGPLSQGASGWGRMSEPSRIVLAAQKNIARS